MDNVHIENIKKRFGERVRALRDEQGFSLESF
jgi:hypothetical protein